MTNEYDASLLDMLIDDDAWLAAEVRQILRARRAGDAYRITFAPAQEGADVIVKPGDFIVNVAELRHQMDARATFGCCGYQGGAEPNALCPNGHAVATVHSDCWHAAFARLIGDSVECVAA